MATVGYGDKTPMTWAGRLLSMVWMFGSIFFIAFFAAVLASSFTVCACNSLSMAQRI